MKLIFSLLGFGVKSSKLYFGRDECVQGPAYWCDSLANAYQCGNSAQVFCAEKHWGAPSLPGVMCETCMKSIRFIEKHLDWTNSLETIVADAEGVLEHMCEKVSNEHKEKCDEIITTGAEVVLDFVQTISDPSIACQGMKLCRAGTEEDLVNGIILAPETLPVAAVHIEESNNILKPIPIDIGFKSNIPMEESETCVLCKMAVAKIDDFLANPDNDGKLLDALEETCDNLPGEYSDRCKALVEMYGTQLINMVEANMAPDVICGALGLCEGFQKRTPSACSQEKKSGVCRALFPAFFFNSTSRECEPFYYGGCGGNHNKFETFDECNNKCTNALGLNVCQDCKLAIAYLDAYISDDANEADIIDALEQVCDSVPDSYKLECEDIIETYGTEILKYADTILDPKFVCEKMELCASVNNSKMPLDAASTATK